MNRISYYTKYIGLLLMILSISLGTGFMVRRHYERQTQLEIMNTFENRLKANKLNMEHIYSGSTSKYRTYQEGETIGILTIERLNIKVSIAEGIGKDALRLSAGHFPSSAMPGKGNFAIAGHSSLVYTCLFNDIHDAVLGDIIEVQTLNDTIYYEITDIFTVDPDQVEVLDPSSKSIITIVTCTNSGKNRLIVRGLEINNNIQ